MNTHAVNDAGFSTKTIADLLKIRDTIQAARDQEPMADAAMDHLTEAKAAIEEEIRSTPCRTNDDVAAKLKLALERAEGGEYGDYHPNFPADLQKVAAEWTRIIKEGCR